jgi:hypothetical protein
LAEQQPRDRVVEDGSALAPTRLKEVVQSLTNDVTLKAQVRACLVLTCAWGVHELRLGSA